MAGYVFPTQCENEPLLQGVLVPLGTEVLETSMGSEVSLLLAGHLRADRTGRVCAE